MPLGNLAIASQRREERDLVHHSAFVVASDGVRRPVVIVNVSPGGFMARCDPAPAVETTVTIQLPGLGAATAKVRWALGGRIGCEFVPALPLPQYYALLARLQA